jgi:hypothetical protein
MLSDEALAAAVTAGRSAILGGQRVDGSWKVSCHAGPGLTAQVTICLRFLGRLGQRDAQATARWLQGQWLGPGRGFAGYPGAEEGDPGVSAVVAGALQACGLRADDPIVADTRALVEARGGEAMLRVRFGRGDLVALFLAMVDLYPAEQLPLAPAAFGLPGAVRAIESRLNVIIPFTLTAADAVVRTLQDGRRRRRRRRSAPFNLPTVSLGEVAAALEARRRRGAFDRFRNEDGSWLYGDCYHAALVLAALSALGVSDDDPHLREGLRFLQSKQIRGRDAAGQETLCYPIFETDVWATAFFARALLAAGEPGDPAVARAVAWLCACQRRGGWAFQKPNSTMPDNDDAAVVLATLAAALERALPAGTALRAREAIAQGREWLFARQNADGGWASFQTGLPGKPRGSIMTGPPALPEEGLWAYLNLLRDPPPDLGDPATEDVTGRVLFGLGRTGSTARQREIARAIDFLRAQQDRNGGWWGRWTVNYLASTAWVLRGLAAVRAELDVPWVRRGRDFLRAHQNPDGGWGESARSYREREWIARGPSTPGLTGLVVCALLEIGIPASDPVVTGGLAHLIDRQRPDGSWPMDGELHALLPPDLFYELPGTESQLALEALAMARQAGSGARVRPEPAAVSPDRGALDHLRGEGDPVADPVVAALFVRNDVGAANRLFHLLRQAGDLVPAQLPPELRWFFDDQGPPAWADPARLDLASRLFQRCSFAVATALACSSLPQCFAFPDGARVLAASSGFEVDARRRLVETAQFVFDVAARGGLGPEGQGVRAAQKVRLMHAAVRHLLIARGWDCAVFGVPINQQQLLGTMLAFSTVVTDALAAMGWNLRDDEVDAWFHLWRVVGVLIGVQPEHLPADAAEGARIMQALRDRCWAASAEGAAQAAAVLSLLRDLVPLKPFRTLPAALVRHLAGARCADLLDLPRADVTQKLLESGVFVLDNALPEWAGRSALAGAAQRACFALMKTLGELNLDGRPAAFQIPAELTPGREPA